MTIKWCWFNGYDDGNIDMTVMMVVIMLMWLTMMILVIMTYLSQRFFQVPIYTKAQAEIPFARVNHDKFMVTDKTAYVGTSNWAADYFTSTGGIGYIINDQSADGIRPQLQSVFERDWNSPYIVPVDQAKWWRSIFLIRSILLCHKLLYQYCLVVFITPSMPSSQLAWLQSISRGFSWIINNSP